MRGRLRLPLSHSNQPSKMIIDTKIAFDFSDEFHKTANTNSGINVAAYPDRFHVVSCDIPEAEIRPEEHSYCSFRCYRDLQGFCAVRGWTIKDVHTITPEPSQ